MAEIDCTPSAIKGETVPIAAADEVVHIKKRRHRKKQLYNSILKQMEFYFSDSNLSKDRFLSQLIKENTYVDLSVFLTFNKIRKLTTSIDDIQKAVRKSNLIELCADDITKIYRKAPIRVKANVDECTIYVERIKSDATHDWLSTIFADFGQVVYVSIPKYAHNRANKGFAFIEFDTEAEALNALNYFDSIGHKMPSSAMPEDLCSIVTFQQEQQRQEELESGGDNNDDDKGSMSKNSNLESKKRKDSSTNNNSEEEDELDNNEEPKRKKIKNIEIKMEDDGHVGDDSTIVPVLPTVTDNNTDVKKKKKHHKKRNYIKELGLQVLAKKDWKKMRNRYLTLQWKKMKEFKQHLRKSSLHYNNKKSAINNEEKVKSTEIGEKDEAVIPTKIEFIPGVIVKLNLTEPCLDPKKLKNDIKSLSSDIRFIDVSLANGIDRDTDIVYIRFNSNDGAKEFCGVSNKEIILLPPPTAPASSLNYKGTVLDGDEELKYWDKIKMDRAVKFKTTQKKQRGRDKLLKKAAKEAAKHIIFDE